MNYVALLIIISVIVFICCFLKYLETVSEKPKKFFVLETTQGGYIIPFGAIKAIVCNSDELKNKIITVDAEYIISEENEEKTRELFKKILKVFKSE